MLVIIPMLLDWTIVDTAAITVNSLDIRYYSPNVNFFRRFALKIYCYFRLYAPDFLYFSWIKKLRSADLDRFKAKCKMKGIHIDPNMKII